MRSRRFRAEEPLDASEAAHGWLDVPLLCATEMTRREDMDKLGEPR